MWKQYTSIRIQDVFLHIWEGLCFQILLNKTQTESLFRRKEPDVLYDVIQDTFPQILHVIIVNESDSLILKYY